MSSTLNVLIAEDWPDVPSSAWVLVDATGAVQQSGFGEPREWPAADRTVAILAGAQATWLTVRLPKASSREQARSLPFAIEELLVREADSQHIVATDKGAESWAVLVVARERLKRITAQFGAIRRPLDAAYAVAQTLPVLPATWSVGIDVSGICIRTDEHGAFSDDLLADEAVPAVLQAGLEQAKQQSAMPNALAVFCTPQHTPPLESWATELGMHVEFAGAWLWHQVDRSAANLLQGEFSPHHRAAAWKQQLRPVAIAAAIVLGLDLLLRVGDIALRRYELTQLQSEMQQIFRTQLPNTPMLDPYAQLRRELNTQRAARGQLADDDALSLLADTAVALGTQTGSALQEIHYEAGGLLISLTPGPAEPNSLVQRLASRGISAQIRDGNPNRLLLRRASI